MTIITVIFILKDTQLDTPPTHLQHTYNHIEDSQNLYLDFLNALDDLQTINSNYDEMNEQLISQTLKDTEDNIPESIKKFRKEILSTKAYNSPFPDPANFDIRGLSEIRAFFRYECALMKEYGKNEEWAKVIQKINLLSSFYNRVNTINSSIEGLILIACRGIYLGAVQHILNQQNLPIDVLKKIILQIDRDRSWQETARQSYTAELQFLKGSLSSPLAADPIHRIMRPNILYNRAIPYFDFFIKSLSTPQIKIKKPTIVDNLNKNKNDYFYLMKHREDHACT